MQRYNASRGRHAPGHLREAFCEWAEEWDGERPLSIKVGYAEDLAGALDNLSHGPPGVSLPGAGTSTTPSTSPSTSPTPPSSSSSAAPPPATGGSTGAPAVLRELNQAFLRLQDAYKTGDLAQIGAAQAEVQRLTAQYIGLLGSASPSPSRSPSPSATR